VMLLADAQHFVRVPEWTWYILFYFFLAGLSGGSYFIATLLRLYGNRSDEPAARLGYYVAFPTLLACPILLTLDLKKPLRFWHMLWNTTPGDEGPIFKYWSPMSVGAWALFVFGVFVTVSFLEVLVRDRTIRTAFTDRAVRLLDGTPGKVWNVAGAVLGLFIAGYTGVLLSVSNQPGWSDTWALGGLFLASGLSGSAALLWWLVRYRSDAAASSDVLLRCERLFAVLELALIVVFALTLVVPGTFGEVFAFPWILLWLVALAGLVPGLGGLVTAGLRVGPEGAVAVGAVRLAVAAPGLVLVGVLALRAAVIFSVQ
jgi:formate-dependent nitrite reductase membrane component NrfD